MPPPAKEPGGRTTFQQVVDEMTDGCGCACHTGLGYNTSCEHCSPAPWSVRIPAAIKKAEEIQAAVPRWGGVFTANQLALAKAFYEFSAATQMLVNAVEDAPPDVIWDPALIEFCEIVEAL